MTAIAYRDGVMVADMFAWNRQDVLASRVKKITHTPDCGLVAATGAGPSALVFAEWAADGFPSRDKPDLNMDDMFSAVYVEPNGRVWMFNWRLIRYPIDHPFVALGGPCEFMAGAMAHGATALEAVTLAAQHTPYIRAPFQIETLYNFAGLAA